MIEKSIIIIKEMELTNNRYSVIWRGLKVLILVQLVHSKPATLLRNGRS